MGASNSADDAQPSTGAGLRADNSSATSQHEIQHVKSSEGSSLLQYEFLVTLLAVIGAYTVLISNFND